MGVQDDQPLKRRDRQVLVIDQLTIDQLTIDQLTIDQLTIDQLTIEMIAQQREGDKTRIVVAPITHTRPADPESAIEIPAVTL
jgi:hypothetical protein